LFPYTTLFRSLACTIQAVGPCREWRCVRAQSQTSGSSVPQCRNSSACNQARGSEGTPCIPPAKRFLISPALAFALPLMMEICGDAEFPKASLDSDQSLFDGDDIAV